MQIPLMGTTGKSTASQKVSLLCKSTKPSLSPAHSHSFSFSAHLTFAPPVLSPVETLTPFHKLFVGFEVSQGLASVCPQSYIHPEFYKGINFFAFGTRERHLFTLSLPLPPHVEPASIFKASMPAPTILSVPHLLIHCSFL